MRVVERGQEREARCENMSAFGDEESAPGCDERSESCEELIVAVRHLEHGEAPETPTVMALLGAMGKGRVLQSHRSQSNERDQARYLTVPQEERFARHVGGVPASSLLGLRGVMLAAVMSSPSAAAMASSRSRVACW